jgi:hypothetical protein
MRFRRVKRILPIVLILALTNGCRDAGSTPEPEGVLEGQVLLISKPGPIPIGWIPPPLEMVTTVIVLDAGKIIVKQTSTDAKGTFSIPLSPGTYYLRVKESPIPSDTGPYTILAGERRTAEAHYDNGMR